MSIPLASPWSEVLRGALALLPAALTWWWGRALARLGDDPALAERLMAHRRRVLKTVITTVVLLGFAGPDALIWTIPLLLVSRAAAALPLRRTLLGETWTFRQYLATGFRLYLGWIGFWVLLAVSPSLISHGGTWVGVSLALLLVAWNHWYAPVLLRLMGARPLADDALAARFAEVVARSRVDAPRVWRAGPPGAVIANAFALPSLGGASVLFSETLLERLNPDEITAIFGHEVAHLEQYPPRRLRRLYVIALLLIAAGTGLVPILGTLAPSLSSPLQLAWPLVVLVVLIVRARSSQAHEYASDRRSVELCGDAEALVNGLIKLHAVALLPRRWEREMERSASHPSLARRIQALRALSERQAPTLEGPAVFPAAESGVAVAFDTDCLRQYWNVPRESASTLECLDRAAGSSRSVRYERLVELRVAARGKAPPELIIAERDGERRRIAMRIEDLEVLQRTLDRVDPLLPPPVPGELGTRPLARLAALVGALTALVGGQLWSVALVALLAAWRPQVRLLLAAAVASLAAALMILGRRTTPLEHGATLAAGSVLLAGVAFWMRQRLSADASWRNERLPVWLVPGLAAAGITAWVVPVIAAQGSLLRLTQTFGTAVGASTLPLAAAVLLVHGRSARWRWAAVALGLAASAPILVGTIWFREGFVHDPFLTPSPEIAIVDPALIEVGRFKVGPWASQVRVSPGRVRVAVVEGNADEEWEGPYAFRVYSAHSNPLEVEANDAQFLDDSHLVTVNSKPNSLIIGVVTLDGPSSAPWEMTLTGLRAGRLDTAPGIGRWRVLGTANDGRLVRFRGKVYEDAVERTEWPPPAGMARWTLQGTAGSGVAALWLHQDRSSTGFAWASPWFASLAGYWPVRSSLYAADESEVVLLGTSEAEVNCLDPPIGQEATVCLASDGSTTHLISVDILRRRTRDIGTLRGRMWATTLGPGTVLAGSWNGAPVLAQLARRRLLRLRRPHSGGISEVAYGSDSIALVAPGAERSTITLYRIGNSMPTRDSSPRGTAPTVHTDGRHTGREDHTGQPQAKG